MTNEGAKKCTKCLASKLFSDFGRRTASPDGLSYWCKSCCSDAKKAHYKENADAIKAKTRAWDKANRDKVNARHRAWYAANLDQARSCKAQYARDHPEKNKEWRSKNKEKVKASQAHWIEQHQDKRKKSVAKSQRKAVEQLKPSYISMALRIPVGHIPPDLLAMKQEQLSAHRLARQLKKAANESSKDAYRITGKHGWRDNAGRPAKDRCQQPVGAGSERDQCHGRGSDGQGPGLDQQQPER